jgi:hypothetical protein
MVYQSILASVTQVPHSKGLPMAIPAVLSLSEKESVNLNTGDENFCQENATKQPRL